MGQQAKLLCKAEVIRALQREAQSKGRAAVTRSCLKQRLQQLTSQGSNSSSSSVQPRQAHPDAMHWQACRQCPRYLHNMSSSSNSARSPLTPRAGPAAPHRPPPSPWSPPLQQVEEQ